MIAANKLLNINLNRPSFFPDEFIEGTVELNVTTQIVLNEITLSLFQLENWIELASVPISETHREQLLIMNLDIKRTLNINTDLVNLSPGRFIFPFKFQLPNKNINPCFEFPSSEIKAYIRYSIDAKIVSPFINGSTSKYVLFKSRPKIDNGGGSKFTSSVDVYKWNIFSEGKITLNVSLLNHENNIKNGSQINFNSDIDNSKGKLNTQECKVNLIRKLNLKKKNNSKNKTVENVCISQTFKTQVKPGNKQTFNFSINLKDMDKKTFNLQNEKLPYFNIPEISFLLPSVKSTTIECDYTMKVTLYFDSFVAHKHRPRVFVPINICHQNMQEYESLINYNLMLNNNNNNNNYQNNNNNYQNNNIITTNNMNNINQNNDINNEDYELPSQEEIERKKDNNIDIMEEDAPAPAFGFTNNI